MVDLDPFLVKNGEKMFIEVKSTTGKTITSVDLTENEFFQICLNEREHPLVGLAASSGT